MLQEEDKFVCNVTVFQVELSEVERVRAGPDRTGPGSILVAKGLLPVGAGLWVWASTCVARGLLPGGPGASTCVAGAFYACGQGSSTSRGGLRKSTTVSSQCHCLSLGRYEDEDMKTKV